MKIRTKLKVGQILYEIYHCKIIRREVAEVRTYADKEIHTVKYLFKDVDKIMSRENVDESDLRKELYFTRKEDAKLYLYDLIAKM